MIDKQQKKFPPLPFILGAVGVIIVVFLGAFIFSFVKSKVVNQPSGNSTGSQQSSGEKSGGTTGTSSVDGQTAQLKVCQKGTFYQTAQGKMTVVGKEDVTIDGSKYEICCWETTSNQFEDKTVQAVKSCMVTDQGAGSMVIFLKKNNRYILQGATVMKNGGKCSYSFDESGTLEDKLCQ